MFDALDGIRLLLTGLVAAAWLEAARATGRLDRLRAGETAAAALRTGRLVARAHWALGAGTALLLGLALWIVVLTILYGGWVTFAELAYVLPALLLPAAAVHVVRRWATPAQSRGQRARLVVIPIQLTSMQALFAIAAAAFPPVPQNLSDWWLASLIAGALVATKQAFPVRPAPEWRSAHGARHRRRLVAAAWVVVAFAAGGAVALSAWESRLPPRLSMMSGTPDWGGGTVPPGSHGGHGDAAAMAGPAHVSVTELTGSCSGGPVRAFTLIAQPTKLTLSSGAVVDAWTFNGQVPGPEIRVHQGDLVKVTLINHLSAAGVTLHWHGYDVPNAEDGVPGVTQDAVQPGGSYTYCFRAQAAGTYWYHSHQVSAVQVRKGLFGSLVVLPKEAGAQDAGGTLDLTLMAHPWLGEDGRTHTALDRFDTLARRAVPPGTAVRLRLINTGNLPETFTLWGTEFRVAAIDGAALNGPTPLRNVRLRLAAGGRYDLTFTMPAGPVRLGVAGRSNPGLLLSPDGTGDVAAPQKAPLFDPTTYGRPAPAPISLDDRFDRRFTVFLDNEVGFYDGRLSFLYTINGRSFPESPMFMVKEGDLVEMTLVNRSSMDHPMHLHGHHVLALSRNGRPITGSPLWFDTLNVAPGETWVIAFQADNPGIWMDHCHNLTHAAAGMMAHLAYEGVTTPFLVGAATPNHLE